MERNVSSSPSDYVEGEEDWEDNQEDWEDEYLND